jgi:hypothetical protein
VAKVRVHMSDDTGTATTTGVAGHRARRRAGPVDLLNLTNGQLAALGSTTVRPAATTSSAWCSRTDGNTVTPIGGTPQPLKTPSGQQAA